MRKLGDKWFWALSLAVLIHIGVFFIFYLNVNQNNTVEVTDSVSAISTPSIVTDIDDNDYSFESKAPVSTFTETKHSDYIVEDSMETDTAPLKKEALKTDDRVINSSRDNKNDREVLSESTEKVIQQKNAIEYQRAEKPIFFSPDNNKILDSVKNDAVLLDIDIPINQHQVEIEGEHLLKKSEAEEVNSQLSAAINEVKKRNQQKIDELEQKKDISPIKNN